MSNIYLKFLLHHIKSSISSSGVKCTFYRYFLEQKWNINFLKNVQKMYEKMNEEKAIFVQTIFQFGFGSYDAV